MQLDPLFYLQNVSFAPERVDQRFPHARRILTGGVFISHSGIDSIFIQRNIIQVLSDRFNDGIFFQNKGFGGREEYIQLVQAALHYCNKFILVLSKNSIGNPWVYAEVDWVMVHQRPIICCLMDSSDPALLHRQLADYSLNSSNYFKAVDFQEDIGLAQIRLGAFVDELLQKPPSSRTPVDGTEI
ncbi:hypothetical protein GCM10023189_06850 [Nibrella saemangeumensis]|uniref:TIR domain-containing protein n=1 Tax=Nibrella saemangeumensis TaxID=1084526 RepID=A0ABP8MFM1_9BACT